MNKCGLSPKDFAKVVFDPPGDVRRHGRVAAELGFGPAQLTDPSGIFMNVGLLGSAMPLMMLVSALEQAEPGEKSSSLAMVMVPMLLSYRLPTPSRN